MVTNRIKMFLIFVAKGHFGMPLGLLEQLRNDNEVLWVRTACLVSSVQTSHVVRVFAFFCFFVAKEYFIDRFTNIIWQPPFFPLQRRSVL